ncbi:MAG: hypothetical protein WC742_00035 [Gallionellaceae bacterium]|jgi:hypothetical protein
MIGSDLIQLGHSNPWRWRHIVETYAKFGIIKFDYNLDGFFIDQLFILLVTQIILNAEREVSLLALVGILFSVLI